MVFQGDYLDFTTYYKLRFKNDYIKLSKPNFIWFLLYAKKYHCRWKKTEVFQF